MRIFFSCCALYCSLFLLSENALCATNKVIGLALDFPTGTLEEVRKVEVYVSNKPYINILGADYGYTNMECNREDELDLCPGYKDFENYLQYLDPSYDGPVVPGALGLDWERIKWSNESPKIVYTGGLETIQPGILDGYIYQTLPEINNIVIYGYPGKIKISFFDTGQDVNKQISFFTFSADIWAIVVEDDWYLSDAILVTQIMAGMDPEVPSDGPYDINGDGDIGLAEAVYMLQKIAGVRSLQERFNP